MSYIICVHCRRLIAENESIKSCSDCSSFICAKCFEKPCPESKAINDHLGEQQGETPVNTQDTCYSMHTEKTRNNTHPRFSVGQEVLWRYRGSELMRSSVKSTLWDREYGGWLVVTGSIGIHEQNFISATDYENYEWEHHENGLWSWWTRKEACDE